MQTAFRFLIRFSSLNFRNFLALWGFELLCQELWFPRYPHYASSSSHFPFLDPFTLLNLLGLEHKLSTTLSA